MTGADGGADQDAWPRQRWDAALSFVGEGLTRYWLGPRCGSGHGAGLVDVLLG